MLVWHIQSQPPHPSSTQVTDEGHARGQWRGYLDLSSRVWGIAARRDAHPRQVVPVSWGHTWRVAVVVPRWGVGGRGCRIGGGGPVVSQGRAIR